MALIKCKECNAQVSDKAKNCPKCGAPVIIKEIIKCFECGTELEKGMKVCSNCGVEQELKYKIIEDSQKVLDRNTTAALPLPVKKSNRLMWYVVSIGALLLILI
ncbi:MAG: zinc ribbon domain-containing protein [Bacteroidia bacterium]|nr:zinc ribbon domain-containing protein [Bacteroidia bacterium]